MRTSILKSNYRDLKRKLVNHSMVFILFTLAILGSIPFLFITFYLFQKGWQSLSWEFLTELPKPAGEEGGGMANAILGSGWMIAMASLLGIPLGLASGTYLSEFGVGWTARFLRFTTDLLTSVPSIIVGIFIYGLIVVRFGFSAYAGSLALSVIMIPIVARTTEEILKLVPQNVREAGLALGLPRWKVIGRIVIPGSLSGLMVGVMLAIARIAGETAPLLFTSLGNQFYSEKLSQPMASLPVQIYNFATSGFQSLESHAWAGSLVLVCFIVLINAVIRGVLKWKVRT